MSASATAAGVGGGVPIQKAAASVRHPLAQTLLILSFTTGLVDACSYLGLDHVFTANMTGNVVLLGFGIAGAGNLPIIAPLVSLGAFLVGAGIGGLLAKGLADRYRRHLGWALAIEVTVVTAAAALAAAIDVHPNTASGDSIIALLAFAMGVRNATVRRIAIPDLTTTVLTMTLTGLAADSPLFGGNGKGSTRRTAAVLSVLAGAVAGALFLKTSLALPLAVAAGLAFVAAVVLRRAADEPERREQGLGPTSR